MSTNQEYRGSRRIAGLPPTTAPVDNPDSIRHDQPWSTNTPVLNPPDNTPPSLHSNPRPHDDNQ